MEWCGGNIEIKAVRGVVEVVFGLSFGALALADTVANLEHSRVGQFILHFFREP